MTIDDVLTKNFQSEKKVSHRSDIFRMHCCFSKDKGPELHARDSEREKVVLFPEQTCVDRLLRRMRPVGFLEWIHLVQLLSASLCETYSSQSLREHAIKGTKQHWNVRESVLCIPCASRVAFLPLSYLNVFLHSITSLTCSISKFVFFLSPLSLTLYMIIPAEVICEISKVEYCFVPRKV